MEKINNLSSNNSTNAEANNSLGVSFSSVEPRIPVTPAPIPMPSQSNSGTVGDAATNGSIPMGGDGSEAGSTQSYYDASAQDTTMNDAKDIMNMLYREAKLRNLDGENGPPGYYDYIMYPHRRKSWLMAVEGSNEMGEGDPDRIFRIGDCYFIIPPEFISVTSRSSHDSIQGIRHSGSIQTKHGYNTKEIVVNLTLNGMDQINGYKVESPFKYNYYVDGLRSLISQFKYTPFVPIENPMINISNGINAVALRSIMVETIEGFPESIAVQLIMQEFNTEPYIEANDALFDDWIDWDLYRWYVQRPLQPEHKAYLPKINTNRLTNNFKFKILKTDHVAKNSSTEITIDLLNDKHYDTIVSSKDDIELIHTNFNLNNILPLMQLSAHSSPTMQYMGASDTEFSFTFETKDKSVVQKFTELNKLNSDLVRNHREKNGIGFIKVENELINLTGTTHVILTDTQISTVPGFPDLFNIVLQCVSYNTNQKDKEKFISFRPFDSDVSDRNKEQEIPEGRLGKMSDLIAQTKLGMGNKIKQDTCAFRKLMWLEMYPDMHLPKYGEADTAITAIRKFRTKHGLSQMYLKKYPRSTTLIPGVKGESQYNGYVDPDFYVMYLQSPDDIKTSGKSANAAINLVNNAKPKSKEITIEDFTNITTYGVNDIVKEANDNLLDMFYYKKITPNYIIEPKYNIGYEPEHMLLLHKGILSQNDQGGTGSENSDIGSDVDWSATGGTGDPSKTPSQVARKTGNPFVDLLINRAEAKCGYVWGASQHGDLCTQDYLNKLNRRFPADTSKYITSRKWIGRQVWDCSAFVCWGLIKVGLKGSKFRITASQMGVLGTRVTNDKSVLQVGDVLYTNKHVVVYAGNGKIVHSSSPSKGCIISNWSKSYKAVRVKGLKEACEKFLRNNPSFYVGNSSSRSSDVPNSSPSAVNNILPLESRVSTGLANFDEQIPYRPIDMDGSSPSSSNNSSSQVVLANFGNGNACDKWNTYILKWSKHFNLDPNFIKCIIMIESSGNPNCYNGLPRNPCWGLMQVNLRWFKVEGGNPRDPEMNIKRGCQTLAEYGKYSYVKYDKKRWLCSYNAGIGFCKWVYVDGTRRLPEQTRKYYEKYDKYYAILKKNGAKAGNRLTPTDGGMSSSGSVEDGTVADGAITDSSSPFPSFDISKLVNPNAGKKRGNKVTKFDIRKVKFKPPSSLFRSNNSSRSVQSNITNGYFNTAFYDYEFPVIGGEISTTDLNGEIHLDSTKIQKIEEFKNDPDSYLEKMLTDEYLYSQRGMLVRAFPSFIFMVIDEHGDWVDNKKYWSNYYVFKSVIDMQVHQAYDTPVSTAKVSLTNMHNNLRKIPVSLTMTQLVESGEFGYLNEKFYHLTGSILNEKITDKMIKYRNQLHERLFIMEGTRIHIRMGYGSNPAKYPTTFNGTVTEIDEGEILTLVAQSDGAELVSRPITDKSNATNHDIGLSAEASNMITEVMTTRENDFLYVFTDLLPWNHIKDRSKYGIEHFGLFVSPKEQSFWTGEQYDIVKNIYKGNYTASYFYEDYKSPFDGEANMRFFASGKTVWDIFKMCEKSMPDFVAYPRPFLFEHRLFYGLPQWLYKFSYDRINGDVYEYAKAFIQFHFIDSLDSIIDNKLKIDTNNLATNMIGIYTLGKDLASTPLIMSDFYIDWSKQKTRTIDTSSVQDFNWVPSLIDKYLEWSGTFDNGKKLAIRVCISELQNSWKETYTNDLLLMGRPQVNAHDIIAINDTFIGMGGSATVREVVHSMNNRTGFTTSLTPGLIAVNKLEYSGLGNVTKACIKAGSFAASFFGLRAANNAGFNTVKTLYSATKLANITEAVFGKGGFVKSFINGTGKNMWKYTKSTKLAVSLTDFVGEASKVLSRIPVLGKGKAGLAKLVGAGKSVAKVVGGTAAATPIGLATIAFSIAMDCVINVLISSVLDIFKYRNCISLYPLYLKNKPFVGGVKEYKDIIAYKDINDYEDITN